MKGCKRVLIGVFSLLSVWLFLYGNVDASAARRDAVFFVVDKNNIQASRKIMLSDYSKDGADTTYSEAKIVKLSDERYAVLWNQFIIGKADENSWDEPDDEVNLCYSIVNQDGEILSERKEPKGVSLSDMDPISIDGQVMWVNVGNEKLLWTLPLS